MHKNQTFKLKRRPKIIGSYTIVGPKEGKGNFGPYFDYVMKNDYFGEKTFEKAERLKVPSRASFKTPNCRRRILT